MAFDLTIWKEKLAARLPGWKTRMKQAGVNSTYAFLSAATLWPVIEAVRQGEWAAAPAALGAVLAGVGTTLLQNHTLGCKVYAGAACLLAPGAAEDAALRAELDAVLDKLNALPLAEQALSEADRAWFAQTMQEELARLGSRVAYQATVTGGGASAQGNGAIALGQNAVYVGGNVNGDVLGPGATKITAPDPRQIEQERIDKARRRYLERLRRQCQALPLAALGSEESAEADVTLDKVYIALNTTERKEGSPKRRGKGPAEEMTAFPDDPRQSPLLTALEAAAGSPRLALLGDPGAGKSTFVKKLLAWQAAAMLGQEAPPEGLSAGLLPVLVTLRDLAPRLAQLDVDRLPSAKRTETLAQAAWEQIKADLGAPCADFEAGLAEALESGRCLLALDGLDEVPHDLRYRTRQMVEAILKTYNPARIIVTCRLRSYVGDAILPAFTSRTLAPFDKQQIQNFVTAWYHTQKELGRISDTQSEARTADLARAALESDLRELSQNPMLLTTMAIIHQREVGLPRERVRLYHLAVEVLLRRWQKHKVGDAVLASFLKDDLKLRAVVEALAYTAHRASATSGETGDLLRKEAIGLLESSELLGSLQLAGEFLDYVDQRAGLLVGRGGELGKPVSYSFPHRTFQEYLAGAYLAGQRDLVRCFYEHAAEGDSWDLAAQLAFEELFYNRRGVNTLLDLAYQLCPGECGSAQSERARLWAGQIAALVGREAVERDMHPNGGSGFIQRLLPGLVQGLGGSLPPVERAEVGRALAKLGDPRPEVMTCKQMTFCFISSGEFVMGSQKGEGDSGEYPQHRLALPDFWISRYPVTNAQFEEFVQAKGYANSAYWHEATQVGVWKNGRITTRFESDERERPYDFGEPFNLPNHPVVGITWYESLAFCRWLGSQLSITSRQWTSKDSLSETERRLWQGLAGGALTVMLPSEAEWEKAARGITSLAVEKGQGERVYPWGDDFDPNQANTSETGIGVPSAVGCFPGGASPFGVQDMSGNVWEWTRSLWGKKYPYGPKDGREKLDARDVPRVLRGGSFFDDAGYARCACRSWYSPDRRYYFIGFRVVVSHTSLNSDR